MKKGLTYLLVLAGLGVGYYFMTGKTPATIPADINRFFNGTQAPPDKNTHKYHRDPTERLNIE